MTINIDPGAWPVLLARMHLAVAVLPCLALTTDPKVRHGRTSPLSCKASCGQLPGVRRRRTLPSLCHSLRGSS